MEREQAVRLTQNLLRKMVEREGSDLFLTNHLVNIYTNLPYLVIKLIQAGSVLLI